MEEGRLVSTDTNPSVSPANTLESAGATAPVSSYAQPSTVYSLDSLESQAPSPQVLNPQATSPTPQPSAKPQPYSKRRSLVVSSAVTAVVIVLTAGVLFALSRRATPGQSSVNGVPSQTLEVKSEDNSAINLGLVSGAQALVVKGDVIARGQLKIAGEESIGSILLEDGTDDRTYLLPNASGTFCLSSNNCNFVTSEVLQGAVDSVDIPASVVTTTVINIGGGASISTSVNGITDTVTLQGTSNQVSVNASGNTITLSTPQDIGTSSSPTFGG